ncbi:MAG: ABC transporter ATP-binding protein [bacterium]
MLGWYYYLKKGLARKKQSDRLTHGQAKTDIKKLWPFLQRHWPKAILGTIIIFVTAAFSYVQPLAQRYLIDKVILGRQLELLAVVVLLLAGISIFQKLGNMLQQFYFARFGKRIVVDIQADLISRVLHFPKAFFDDKETGYLMSRLAPDVQGLGWFFSGTIVYVISNIFRFIAGVALLVYLEWRLAVGAIVFLPFFAVVAIYFSRKVRILSHFNMEQQAGVTRRLQEVLSAIPLFKAFATEKQEAAKVVNELNKAYHLELEQSVTSSFAATVIGSLGDIARLFVLVAGVPLVVGGSFSAGSLFAFFAYINYVYGPVQFMAQTSFQLQRALTSLERISAFYDILPEEPGQGVKVEHLKGEIEFKNVSFSYNGEGRVLENVSFSVAAGESVAIVGPSGGGKTTLISLLLDFYRPTAGEILFDGRLVQEYAVDSLRRRIGYVAQGTRLLSGTIRDNLCYGNPEASEEDVIRAAKIADIHEFITNLPKGYDSLLGENAVNLSEGERQRISIARALVKDPDILILDEPSSSLDSATEESIIEALPAAVRNKTLIVITHRESTIKAADRVLRFEDKCLY